MTGKLCALSILQLFPEMSKLFRGWKTDVSCVLELRVTNFQKIFGLRTLLRIFSNSPSSLRKFKSGTKCVGLGG